MRPTWTPWNNFSTTISSTLFQENNTTASNVTFHQSCRVIYKEFKYLPWNNPDNILTLDTAVQGLKVLCGIFMPLISFFGMPANVFNGLVFFRQGIQKRINFLLCCLACADFVVVLYMFLHTIEFLYTQIIGKFQMYGPFLTYVVNKGVNVLHGFVYVSGFISTLIAIERCICITYPFRAKKFLKTRRTGIMVAVCAVVLVGVHVIILGKYRVECAFYPQNGLTLKGYYSSSFYLDHMELVDILNGVVYGLLLPAFFLITTTITTIVTAVKLKDAAVWRQGQTSATQVESKELAVTRMLIAVSCLFITCTLPNIIVRTAPFFMPEFRLGGRQQNSLILGVCVLHTLPTINSSLNFFFYLKMSSKFRMTSRNVLGLKVVTSKSVQSSVTNF